MNESTKKSLLIVVVVVAVVIAGYSVFSSMSGPKEEVVGTLPMATGGGRDAEKGNAAPAAPATDPAQAADPSGMPESVRRGG